MRFPEIFILWCVWMTALSCCTQPLQMNFTNLLHFRYGGIVRDAKADTDVLGDCRILNICSLKSNLLPADLWVEVFRNLDLVSLIRVSRVCRTFYLLAKRNSVWKAATKRNCWFKLANITPLQVYAEDINFSYCYRHSKDSKPSVWKNDFS